jgi:ADP-ribose pyrophosphatase
MKKPKIIETLNINKVYENDFMDVFDNDVRFPSGKKGRYIRTRWKAPHGVAMLPVLNDDVLLIDNYRYSELSHSMEVPQGFGTDGNSPEEDARRELFEEIGAHEVELTLIGQTGKDYITYLYRADLPSDFSPCFDAAEDTESITEVKKYSKKDLKETPFVELNIFDPVTQICLLKFIQ